MRWKTQSVLILAVLSAFLLATVGCGTESGGTSDVAADVGPDTTSVDSTDLSFQDQGNADISEPTVELTTIQVVENPRNNLSALVSVVTSETNRCYVEYGVDDEYGLETGLSATGTEHEITVVQMRQLTDYHLRIVAVTESGQLVRSQDQVFSTGAIPDDIPDFTVSQSDSDVEPGVTMFFPGGVPDEAGCPYYVGVDEAGELVWYHRLTGGECRSDVGDIKPLENGNLLLTIANENGFTEITIGGEIVQEFMAHDLEYPVFHHEAIKLPNGRYMTLSVDQTQVSVDWNPEPITVMGDVIVEINEQGQVTWEWSTLDHLDTTRFPGELSRNSGDPYDWTHSNTLDYVEETNSVLLSMRHQNWVINIDRDTGDILWRAGEDGDFTLENEGAGASWFYGQHGAEMLDDDVLLLYDNGNHRPGLQPEQWTSRGVMYQLDLTDMTAQQIWSYVTPYFTGFQGDANELSDGNVLLCAGGVDGAENPALLIEVTPTQPAEVVWMLEVNFGVYRATQVPTMYFREE